MSENRVNVDDVAVTPVALNLDPAVVAKTLATVLKIGGGVAKLTATDVDDKVVETLQKLVDEPWFGEVLALVLSLVNSGKSGSEIVAAVQGVVGSGNDPRFD